MFTFSLLLTIYTGFTHAFEVDHLLAVSNIVSQRNSIKSSMKDGIFWGLGHASTIFFLGLSIIVFKAYIQDPYFHYFEAMVGIMLVALAIYRLIKFFRGKKIVAHAQIHDHNGGQHKHLHMQVDGEHIHTLAYGIGLVHGLAGSGALILIAMSQMKNTVDGILYLIILAGGCIAGMLVAAGLLSVPFSKKIIQTHSLQSFLIIATSLLCFLYGSKIIYKNIFA